MDDCGADCGRCDVCIATIAATVAVTTTIAVLEGVLTELRELVRGWETADLKFHPEGRASGRSLAIRALIEKYSKTN